MPPICQTFVQNSWNKDICSNCFRAEGEHDDAPKDTLASKGNFAKELSEEINSKGYIGLVGNSFITSKMYTRNYYGPSAWSAIMENRSSPTVLKSPSLIRDLDSMIKQENEKNKQLNGSCSDDTEFDCESKDSTDESNGYNKSNLNGQFEKESAVSKKDSWILSALIEDVASRKLAAMRSAASVDKSSNDLLVTVSASSDTSSDKNPSDGTSSECSSTNGEGQQTNETNVSSDEENERQLDTIPGILKSPEKVSAKASVNGQLCSVSFMDGEDFIGYGGDVDYSDDLCSFDNDDDDDSSVASDDLTQEEKGIRDATEKNTSFNSLYTHLRLKKEFRDEEEEDSKEEAFGNHTESAEEVTSTQKEDSPKLENVSKVKLKRSQPITPVKSQMRSNICSGSMTGRSPVKAFKASGTLFSQNEVEMKENIPTQSTEPPAFVPKEEEMKGCDADLSESTFRNEEKVTVIDQLFCDEKKAAPHTNLTSENLKNVNSNDCRLLSKLPKASITDDHSNHGVKVTSIDEVLSKTRVDSTDSSSYDFSVKSAQENIPYTFASYGSKIKSEAIDNTLKQIETSKENLERIRSAVIPTNIVNLKRRTSFMESQLGGPPLNYTNEVKTNSKAGDTVDSCKTTAKDISASKEKAEFGKSNKTLPENTSVINRAISNHLHFPMDVCQESPLKNYDKPIKVVEEPPKVETPSEKGNTSTKCSDLNKQNNLASTQSHQPPLPIKMNLNVSSPGKSSTTTSKSFLHSGQFSSTRNSEHVKSVIYATPPPLKSIRPVSGGTSGKVLNVSANSATKPATTPKPLFLTSGFNKQEPKPDESNTQTSNHLPIIANSLMQDINEELSKRNQLGKSSSVERVPSQDLFVPTSTTRSETVVTTASLYNSDVFVTSTLQKTPPPLFTSISPSPTSSSSGYSTNSNRSGKEAEDQQSPKPDFMVETSLTLQEERLARAKGSSHASRNLFKGDGEDKVIVAETKYSENLPSKEESHECELNQHVLPKTESKSEDEEENRVNIVISSETAKEESLPVVKVRAESCDSIAGKVNAESSYVNLPPPSNDIDSYSSFTDDFDDDDDDNERTGFYEVNPEQGSSRAEGDGVFTKTERSSSVTPFLRNSVAVTMEAENLPGSNDYLSGVHKLPAVRSHSVPRSVEQSVRPNIKNKQDSTSRFSFVRSGFFRPSSPSSSSRAKGERESRDRTKKSSSKVHFSIKKLLKFGQHLQGKEVKPKVVEKEEDREERKKQLQIIHPLDYHTTGVEVIARPEKTTPVYEYPTSIETPVKDFDPIPTKFLKVEKKNSFLKRRNKPSRQASTASISKFRVNNPFSSGSISTSNISVPVVTIQHKTPSNTHLPVTHSVSLNIDHRPVVSSDTNSEVYTTPVSLIAVTSVTSISQLQSMGHSYPMSFTKPTLPTVSSVQSSHSICTFPPTQISHPIHLKVAKNPKNLQHSNISDIQSTVVQSVQNPSNPSTVDTVKYVAPQSSNLITPVDLPTSISMQSSSAHNLRSSNSVSQHSSNSVSQHSSNSVSQHTSKFDSQHSSNSVSQHTSISLSQHSSNSSDVQSTNTASTYSSNLIGVRSSNPLQPINRIRSSKSVESEYPSSLPAPLPVVGQRSAPRSNETSDRRLSLGFNSEGRPKPFPPPRKGSLEASSSNGHVVLNNVHIDGKSSSCDVNTNQSNGPFMPSNHTTCNTNTQALRNSVQQAFSDNQSARLIEQIPVAQNSLSGTQDNLQKGDNNFESAQDTIDHVVASSQVSLPQNTIVDSRPDSRSSCFSSNDDGGSLSSTNAVGGHIDGHSGTGTSGLQSAPVRMKKPTRPPPPRRTPSNAGGRISQKMDSLYANLGNVRAAFTPRKPDRSASLRDDETEKRRGKSAIHVTALKGPAPRIPPLPPSSKTGEKTEFVNPFLNHEYEYIGDSPVKPVNKMTSLALLALENPDITDRLALLVDQISGDVEIPKFLSTASKLSWECIKIKPDTLKKCGRRYFYSASFVDSNVDTEKPNITAMVTQELKVKHDDHLMPKPFAVFIDELPSWVVGVGGENVDSHCTASVWILPYLHLSHLNQLSQSLLKVIYHRPSEWQLQVCSFLLQLVIGLKHLQAAGTEESSLDQILVAEAQLEGHKTTSRLILTSPSPEISNMLSLCHCAAASVVLLLGHCNPTEAAMEGPILSPPYTPSPHAFSSLVETLREERASSLTKAKCILEAMLFGPPPSLLSTKNSDIDQILQSWIDSEKLKVLRCLEGNPLNSTDTNTSLVFQFAKPSLTSFLTKLHLSFLVHCTPKSLKHSLKLIEPPDVTFF